MSPDHIRRNRGSWDAAAAEHAEPGREAWASEEARWGIWRVQESLVGVFADDLEGKDVIEHGCGAGYVSAWLARRGARPVGIDLSWNQLASAARLQREFGLRFPVIHGDAERAPLRLRASTWPSASTAPRSGATRTGGSPRPPASSGPAAS
ncbi:MAG: class I SAM-dependent methyltransferase [Candidatus Methylomirabilales bacterium]